nr:MAG TPA: hypothetical protein [Caudoviricetes sp.]
MLTLSYPVLLTKSLTASPMRLSIFIFSIFKSVSFIIRKTII